MNSLNEGAGDRTEEMEVFQEEGIVLEKHGEVAEVAIVEKGDCNSCAAKPYCVSVDNSCYSKLTVLDRLNSKPGDEVVIEVKGADLLKAVIMVYGIPLFLFIFVIGIIIYFLGEAPLKEVVGLLAGVGTLLLYIGLMNKRLKSARVKKSNLPKTIKIKKSFQSVDH